MLHLGLRYVWDKVEICYRYSRNKLKYYMPKYTQAIPKIYLGYVWDMPEIYLLLALDIPPVIYMRYTWNISEIYLRYTSNIPDVYLPEIK